MQSFDISVDVPEGIEPGNHQLSVSIPIHPGVNLQTGENLSLPQGMPPSISIPLLLKRS
jgi:hypothetical protein